MTHGHAKLDGDILTVTAIVRGKPVVSVFQVEDSRPDVRVADPAYKLTKVAAVDGELKPTGEVYHVCVDDYGPRCDCADSTYRGSIKDCCKHARAMRAVGLLPKGFPP